MFSRWCPSVVLLTLLVLSCPALAQEQELLKGQAGRYPLRAYLREPAAVGPAKMVVELGAPKELAKLPESKHTPAVDEPPPPPPRDLAVSVVMEMPDMVSTRPTSVALSPTAPNRFEGDVLITMKGDWRVQFVVQTPEGEFRPLAKFKVGPNSSSSASGENGLELCDPSQGDAIPLKIRSSPDPARVGANRIKIELPQDITVPVMVGVSMPGLALGIPPQEAIRQDDGSYEATVHLPMAGYWQLRVDLNGNAPPPFALTVEEPRTSGPNRALLPIVMVTMVPVLVFVALRRRSALKPVLGASAFLLAILATGAVIERFWPSQHSGSMEMDMLAADMGMGRLSAPLPVLESKLEKTPFVTTQSYPATVIAAKESVVISHSSGVLAQLAPVGSYLASGDGVAKVGAETIRAASSGVVLQHFQNEGSSISSGTAVLSLSDPKRLAVRARAPLSDRDMLQVGLPVDVYGRDGQKTTGKLSVVSGVGEGQSLTVEAVFDNTRPIPPAHAELGIRPSTPRVDLGTFVPGQSVTLKVALEGRRSAITVPREAVRQSPDGEARVFLVTPIAGQRIAREQKVTLGEIGQTQVEVVSGLSEGQIIVAKLEPSLRDGDVIIKATLGGGVYRSLVVPGDGSH